MLLNRKLYADAERGFCCTKDGITVNTGGYWVDFIGTGAVTLWVNDRSVITEIDVTGMLAIIMELASGEG